MGIECCQSVNEVHEADDQMVGASQCDTDSAMMGGGVGFAEGVSCTEMTWYEAPQPTDEPEVTGCCYSYGYGAMMAEVTYRRKFCHS